MIVSMDLLALFLDEFDEGSFAQPVVGGLDEQLLDEWLERLELLRAERWSAIGDETSLPRMAGKHALIGEAADGFLDGVRVHAEFTADHPHRRHLLARLELASGDGFFHRSDDLLVDRLAQLEVDQEWQHETVLLVVIQIVQRNQNFWGIEKHPRLPRGLRRPDGLLDLADNATLLLDKGEEGREGKQAHFEKRKPDFTTVMTVRHVFGDDDSTKT